MSTDDHTLLAHLASRLTGNQETLATEALAWLLRRPAPRRALHSLAAAIDVDLPLELNYYGQVGKQDTGRPDIVGLDEEKRERLLIEAKFAATLTDKQPVRYLDRLPDDVPGLLLVVAPEYRVLTLWRELMQRLGNTTDLQSLSSGITAAPLHVLAGPGRRLALTSWRHVVQLMLAQLEADRDPIAHDCRQLLSLTEAMDAAEFLPFRFGDYSREEARRVYQLQGLVDAVSNEAHQQGDVVKVSRASGGRFYYGCKMRTAGSRNIVWIQFRPWAWANYAVSPLWIKIPVLKGGWSKQRLQDALVPLASAGEPGLFDLPNEFLVPVLLPEHSGMVETVSAVVTQLQRVGALLDSARAANELPLPETVADEDSDDSEGVDV